MDRGIILNFNLKKNLIFKRIRFFYALKYLKLNNKNIHRILINNSMK